MYEKVDSKAPTGNFKPTLILHGGAGAITRANLPPELYDKYERSLLSYLISTKAQLDAGKSALDAACYAVSLMEDDPLFNCGRGSVFTTSGTIEMEASVMVTSVDRSEPQDGHIKKGAAVSLVRNTRHPILLAKEVLLDADRSHGLGGTSTMHCHLSGASVEEWGFDERGLERKANEWFWTKRRWEEHRRGLEGVADARALNLPSQGTVGAVCMDSFGSLAVATSTGGLTNKAPGRIGDTPTVGAGFWAEAWTERHHPRSEDRSWSEQFILSAQLRLSELVQDCFPQFLRHSRHYSPLDEVSGVTGADGASDGNQWRAVAMSGTGNGDSFLRTDAARTTAAICRYSTEYVPFADAVSQVTGPGGELQRSAGSRWNRTGEGQGGIIGLEVCSRGSSTGHESDGREKRLKTAEVVFDFNCGGLWRAWYARPVPSSDVECPQVMVFREPFRRSPGQ